MNREKSVSVRFAAVGGQIVKGEMRDIGQAGRDAMQAVSGSTAPANASFDRFSAAAAQARAQLEQIASKAAASAAQLRTTAAATSPLVDQINRLTGVTPAIGQSTAEFLRQGQVLDDLRAKYNPVFGVIRQYRQEVSEMRAAHLEGALSADELAAAISRSRVAALNSIAAYKGSAQQIGQMSRAARGGTLRLQQMFFQVNDIGVSLAGGMNPFVVMAQQGTQIAQIYGFGNGGVSAAIKDLGGLVTGFLSRFAPLAILIGGVTLGIAGMRAEINATQDQVVSFGDVALGTWQVIRDGIWDFIKPAVDEIAPWFSAAWDLVVSGVKWVGNTIIQGIQLAIEGVRFTVGAIPLLFKGAWEGAKAFVFDSLAAMLEELNRFLTLAANSLNSTFGLNLSGPSGDTAAGLRDRAAAARAASSAADDTRGARFQTMVDNMTGIVNNDPLGEFFDAVRNRATQNARDRAEEDGAGGGAASKVRDEVDELVKSLTQELTVLRETDPVKQRMLELADKLVDATDAQKQKVLDLVIALDQAKTGFEAVGRSLSEYAEQSQRIGQEVGDAFVGAFEGAEDAVAQFVKTGKFEVTDLVASLLADLAKISTGKFILGPLAGALGKGLSAASGGSGFLAELGSVFADIGSNFEGGGHTGFGARAGGLDGKGGFLAMLHPQERVYDEAKGQRAGGNMTVVNFNGVRDVESFRRSRAQIAADFQRGISMGSRAR